MGWFKRLFASKPGGTFMGNLCRAIGNKATSGMYGDIFPAPPCGRVASTSGIVVGSSWYDACRSSQSGTDIPIWDQPISPLSRETTMYDGQDFFNSSKIDFDDMLILVAETLEQGGVVPESVVDAVDGVLGEEAPPELVNTIGITPSGTIADNITFQNATSNLDELLIDLSIDTSGNSTTDTTSSSSETWGKIKTFVTENIIGFGVGLSVLVVGVGYLIYKRNNPY